MLHARAHRVSLCFLFYFIFLITRGPLRSGNDGIITNCVIMELNYAIKEYKGCNNSVQRY